MGPSCLERGVRDIDVADGQVVPLHEAGAYLGADLGDAVAVELVGLHQGDDRGGAPGRYGVEVDSEVAVVASRQCIRLLLAGGEGDAD